jgi:hypothetical protein
VTAGAPEGGRHAPDESTLGGYVSIHGRPPAFEGVDGLSYTVAALTAETGDAAAPLGGYLLFVRWGSGEPTVRGHIESNFLARGQSEEEIRAALDRLPLLEVKQALDDLLRGAR